MTWGLAFLIVGALWIKSSTENRSVQDILRGVFSAGGPGAGTAGFQSDLLGSLVTRGGTAPPATAGTDATVGGGSGTVNYKGDRVCAKFIPALHCAERHGWRGTVTSGVRTPAQSVAACMGICGAPRCPGTCAGEDSNHNGCDPGAIDVSDHVTFARAMQQCGNPLRNALPNDRIHFSESGQ